MGTLPERAKAACTEKWEDTEDSHGRDGFQELFAHVRMIYRKTKLAETVLEEYRKYTGFSVPTANSGNSRDRSHLVR